MEPQFTTSHDKRRAHALSRIASQGVRVLSSISLCPNPDALGPHHDGAALGKCALAKFTNWLTQLADRMPDWPELLALVRDLLALAKLKELLQSKWGCSHLISDKLEAIMRFKTQIQKAVTFSAVGMCHSSGYVQLGQMPMSVPWMECNDSVSLVYIPSACTLEVDLSLRSIQALPKALSLAHGIREVTPGAQPRQPTTDVDAAALLAGQILTFLLMGGGDPSMCDVVKLVSLKLSVVVKASSVLTHPSPEGDPEWHHIDIDDMTEIQSLKDCCPDSNAWICKLETVIAACNSYLDTHHRIRGLETQQRHGGTGQGLDSAVAATKPHASW